MGFDWQKAISVATGQSKGYNDCRGSSMQKLNSTQDGVRIKDKASGGDWTITSDVRGFGGNGSWVIKDNKTGKVEKRSK
jgi:hypothetical protein